MELENWVRFPILRSGRGHGNISLLMFRRELHLETIVAFEWIHVVRWSPVRYSPLRAFPDDPGAFVAPRSWVAAAVPIGSHVVKS